MADKWMNAYTGEVYRTLPEAIATMISDMAHFKKCRNVKFVKGLRAYKELECIAGDCTRCPWYDQNTGDCRY